MTYVSRYFLISGGEGSDERTPRFSKRLSSAMMSLQTSTHSSQMKTVGPAISLRTSFWSLLQNEQRRISVSPFFLTISYGFSLMLHPFPDDVIDYPVFLPLVGRHDVVALGVFLDPLERLPGVVHQDFIQALAHAQNFAGMNVDIGRLSRQPLHQRLMNDDARIGQRKPLALGAGRQQHRRHRRRLADADGLHVRLDELHRVVDRQPRGDRPAWTVDVQH